MIELIRRKLFSGRRTVGPGRPPRPARFRRIWWQVVTLTLLVSIAPLVLMTEINHFMYRRALRTEIQNDVLRDVTTVSRSLAFVLEERLSALKLLVREKSLADLNSNVTLGRTLQSLKESVGGFVDLGVIDGEGRQEFYVGPYNLLGERYEGEDWFNEVVVRGVFVSEVFMGHRKLPHFVIAVRHDVDQESFFILRATVDMDLLTRILYAPDTGPDDDVFVISRNGILQTSSRHHGELLQTADVPVPPYSPEVEIVERQDEPGGPATMGYRYIDSSPFILVMIKHPLADMAKWRRARVQVLFILGGGTLLVVLVVLWSSSFMVRQIRAADRRRAESLRRMEFTSKMATIGRLAASVAHEINNPLAIINEKAGLLKDLVEHDPEHPHRAKSLASLESIVRSVERCGDVTHRLLGFTRRLDTRIETINLPNLLNEVLSFTGKEAAHRNITVETHVGEGVPAIQSDRGRLQQVFLNLISNALAAVREGGRIDLFVKRWDENSVAVFVKDDGVGIPQDQLPFIFEPHFSMKGEFGTGLGLSIVREILEKLGGKIDIESEVGEGTSVSVLLPVSTVIPKGES